MRYLSLSGGLVIVALIGFLGWAAVEVILWLLSFVHISAG